MNIYTEKENMGKVKFSPTQIDRKEKRREREREMVRNRMNRQDR